MPEAIIATSPEAPAIVTGFAQEVPLGIFIAPEFILSLYVPPRRYSVSPGWSWPRAVARESLGVMVYVAASVFALKIKKERKKEEGRL